MEEKGAERKGDLPNLTMSGWSRANGGEYGNVQIDGVAKVAGNLSAAYGIRAQGVVNVGGNVYAPELRCEGKVTVDGGMISRTVYLDGMLKVSGRIEADSLKLDGFLTAGSDIEAETFIGRGVVKTDGLLNAGTVELGLAHKTSKVREIGGETVIVRRLGGSRWSWLWSWALPSSESRLDAELIEGDIVRLEYTHAAVVRGGQIVIGKGCKIGKAEYKMRLTVHPEGVVDKEEKIGE
ncbi:FapA family protein [Paenibacillus sp. LHD-117]|uniref:FapA family protein n=1 Tax=Paenibacillus sp. LHD-117 TaxID=3071412 RepID=UPI0027E1D9AD|nr:FapA family protein [Paenibacillus sp. LHD-117]MDQ6423356.1 FapA family protein [Paenibacillus sp. LHD-117]